MKPTKTYPITHSLPGQITPVPFVVDGHMSDNPDSDLQGDGQFPPFYVFDPNNQVNIAGPFHARERAEQERVTLSKRHGVPLDS